MNNEIIVCECKQCGYHWLPRSLSKPARCPKCQTRDWQRSDPRTEKQKADLKAMNLGSRLYQPLIIDINKEGKK